MNRVTYALFTALGLILANALLAMTDAQAYPSSCTPTQCAGCWYCASPNQTVNTLPVSLYSNSNCTGSPVTENTIYDAILGNQLPSVNPTVYWQLTWNPPTGCSGTCCNDGTCCSGSNVCYNGTCCTPSWSTCGGCTPTCSSSCTGTQSNGCGNTQSCTIPALSCICSSSYTTAANLGGYTTNTQNYLFCDLSGGNITGVSDACQGTNNASQTCNPVFTATDQTCSISACLETACPTVCPMGPVLCSACSNSATIGNCGQTCPATCACPNTCQYYLFNRYLSCLPLTCPATCAYGRWCSSCSTVPTTNSCGQICPATCASPYTCHPYPLGGGYYCY